MAKLEIRKRERERGLTMCDYDILIDGQEPSGMLELKLDMGFDAFNQAAVTFSVEDIHVDGDFLALIEAKANDETDIKVDANEPTGD